MRNLVYGVDFGTTNSALAYVQEDAIQIVTHGDAQSQTMPSLLFFPNDQKGCLVGEAALAHYVDGSLDGRLLQSIKSTLPEKWLKGTQAQGRWYDIEDLIALIIKDLKQKADRVTGQDVKKVVLGRPAVFSHDPEKEQFAEARLTLAARKAGFEEIFFQIEPIAAALYYESSLTRSELVLVADFGGGTSDFTVMRLAPAKVRLTNRRADILGTRGVPLAGDKLDSAVMWQRLTSYFGAAIKWSTWDNKAQWLDMPAHIMHAICDWRQIAFLRESQQRKRIADISYAVSRPEALAQYGTAHQEAMTRLEALIDENLGFALFKAIEQAKAALSQRDAAAIVFHEDPIHIMETLTRSAFDAMIAPEIQQIEQCLADFLCDIAIAPAEIDAVFLTGGTAYVPRIRQILSETFGAAKLRGGDAFISVVSGLALSSRLFFEAA